MPPDRCRRSLGSSPSGSRAAARTGRKIPSPGWIVLDAGPADMYKGGVLCLPFWLEKGLDEQKDEEGMYEFLDHLRQGK